MKQVVKPSLQDVLNDFKNDIFLSLNCHRIGIIQSFDANYQTATIQLTDKRVLPTYEGTITKNFAPLICCPVYVLGGSNAWIDQPFTSGDECLVLFNDRNFDNWFISGDIQAPPNARAHSMQDALAIVGFRSNIKAIQNYDSTAFGLRKGNAKIQIDQNEKIDIRNNAQDLKTLISSLISILESLKTVNGASQYPIDSTTATALSNLQTQFNSLLK